MKLISVALLGLLALLSFEWQPVQAQSKADQIIRYAKMTAQLKNQGHHGKANEAMKATQRAFEEAVEEDPTDPQPHLHMGVFYTNTNKFKESIDQLNIALEKLGQGNPQGVAQIKGQIQKAKYGMYSMKRDQAYQSGKGNVTRAHAWGLKQLQVSPHPDATSHEVATMEMMLCERNAKYCAAAEERFQQSHQLACQRFGEGYEQFRKSPVAKDTGASRCKKPIQCLLSGSWQKQSDLTTLELLSEEDRHSSTGGSPKNGNIYLHTSSQALTGLGRDGLLQVHNSPDCSVLLPTNDYFANLHDNLILPNQQQHQRDRPFITTGQADYEGPVLSLAQFSGAAFYHWLAEGLPRLVLAKKHWPDFDDALILVSGKNKKHAPTFVLRSLELVLGAEYSVDPPAGSQGVKRLGLYQPRMVYPGGGAFVAWDPQPCPQAPGTTGDEERPGCASLTHPVALREARSAMHAALDKLRGERESEDNPNASPYVLLAMRGKDVTMRQYDEEKLHKNIVSVVTNYVRPLGGGYGIKTFVGEDYSFEEAMTLFRGAAVVVGVHGGALTNILACSGGKKSALLEIGFKTSAARHYQHMASSLGLHYEFEPVSEVVASSSAGSDEAEAIIEVGGEEEDQSSQQGDTKFLDRALGAPEIDFNVNSVMKKLLGVLRALDSSSTTTGSRDEL